jgi:hypothetical protein
MAPTSFDRYKTQAFFESQRFLLTATGTIAPYIAAGINPAVRTLITNPALNIFNHASNMAVSADVGVFTGILGSSLYSHYIEKPTERSSALRKARMAMAVAGLAVGAVINGLIETRLGISITHIYNTADPYDAAYGIIAASASAAFGPRLEAVPIDGNDQFDSSYNTPSSQCFAL